MCTVGTTGLEPVMPQSLGFKDRCVYQFHHVPVAKGSAPKAEPFCCYPQIRFDAMIRWHKL